MKESVCVHVCVLCEWCGSGSPTMIILYLKSWKSSSFSVHETICFRNLSLVGKAWRISGKLMLNSQCWKPQETVSSCRNRTDEIASQGKASRKITNFPFLCSFFLTKRNCPHLQPNSATILTKFVYILKEIEMMIKIKIQAK